MENNKKSSPTKTSQVHFVDDNKLCDNVTNRLYSVRHHLERTTGPGKHSTPTPTNQRSPRAIACSVCGARRRRGGRPAAVADARETDADDAEERRELQLAARQPEEDDVRLAARQPAEGQPAEEPEEGRQAHGER